MIIVCQECGHHNPHNSTMERLWNQVDKSGECWVWIGRKNNKGYGGIHADGRSGKTYLTHRVVWENTYGPIPAGLCVLHKCDNPPCCRPDHLFLGTANDNMRDMIQKGRHYTPFRGERNSRHKLTEQQVIAIRTEYAEGRATIMELADQHDVSTHSIGALIRGKAWKHLPLITATKPPKKPTRSHGYSKLTKEQVIAIRAEYIPGMGYKELAKKYGIDPSHAYRVVAGKVWKHLL